MDHVESTCFVDPQERRADRGSGHLGGQIQVDPGSILPGAEISRAKAIARARADSKGTSDGGQKDGAAALGTSALGRAKTLAQFESDLAESPDLRSALELREIFKSQIHFEDSSSKMIRFMYGYAGKPKLYNYDLKLLVTYGGILTMFMRGTVLRDMAPIRKRLFQNILMLGVFILVVKVWADNSPHPIKLDQIQLLNARLNFMVPFVVGLFLKNMLERWWSLRVEALGVIFDGSHEIAKMATVCLPELEHLALRQQVVRWCLASIILIMKAARDDAKLDDLLERGILGAREVGIIDAINQPTLYPRAMLLWGWVMRALQEEANSSIGPAPHTQMFTLVMMKAVEVRDAMQTIHTFMDSQLPFGYVHLVTLLVDVLCAVITLKYSLVFVKELKADNPNIWVIIFEGLLFIVLPTIYCGLIAITHVCHDPFGDEFLDFPMAGFAANVAEQCEAELTSQARFPYVETARAVEAHLDKFGRGPSVHGNIVKLRPQLSGPKLLEELRSRSKPQELSSAAQTPTGAPPSAAQRRADVSAADAMAADTAECVRQVRASLARLSGELGQLRECVLEAEDHRAGQASSLGERLDAVAPAAPLLALST